MSEFCGARWVRAALQVNPFAYEGNNPPSEHFNSEDEYNAALLDECEALGIELIAVTDHWCVDSAAPLIEASAARTVTVLPGFEANTSEGIHLLVLFEAGTDLTAINAAIGKCGDTVTPGCGSGTLGHSYDEIMRRMTAGGALVIPAHANASNTGMLGGRRGVPLVNMIMHSDLHAVGISPGIPDAPDQAAIFAGTSPFDRQHPIARIHADDVNSPVRLAEQGATSWFKMGEPSLLGLKHAVRMPETRVKLVNPASSPRVLFRKLSWIGGFLDEVQIDFADDLTALIGGRGTGKSTLIESLRYVLGLEAIGEVAKRDHAAVIDRVLGSGTVIKLVVDALSPSEGQFTIQRSVNDPPVVYDASNTRTQLTPRDVVGQVEIFGQHELAEVAQAKDHVALMIERIAGGEANDDARRLAKRLLTENREQLAKVEANENDLAEELSEIGRLEETVRHFRESGWVAQLDEKERLDKDEAVFTEAVRRLNQARGELNSTGLLDMSARLSSGFDEVDSSPRRAILDEVVASVTKAADAVSSAHRAIEAALGVADSEVNAASDAWTAVTQGLVDRHAELLRELKDAKHDPDRYLAFTRRLGELKVKTPELARLGRRIEDLKAERSRLLGQLDHVETTEKERLNNAVRRANAATGGAVIVRPIASPERGEMRNVVTRLVAHQRARLLELVDSEDFSPRAFVNAARVGEAELESKFGIRGAQATAVIDAGEAFFRELEELSIPRAVDVALDVGVQGRREYRSLEDLSKGQRATALLLLLLAAAHTPLVIDQPEDDLDNRFVYDQIVHRFRDLKGGRQVIVSTHNANIPVLGDAELVATLEGDGSRAWLKDGCTGSLDAELVREAVEQLLEGGRAAFEARRHLYGIR